MERALELRAIPYDHHDATVLTALVQTYYAEIYGGPDDDPLTATRSAGGLRPAS